MTTEFDTVNKKLDEILELLKNKSVISNVENPTESPNVITAIRLLPGESKLATWDNGTTVYYVGQELTFVATCKGGEPLNTTWYIPEYGEFSGTKQEVNGAWIVSTSITTVKMAKEVTAYFYCSIKNQDFNLPIKFFTLDMPKPWTLPVKNTTTNSQTSIWVEPTSKDWPAHWGDQKKIQFSDPSKNIFWTPLSRMTDPNDVTEGLTRAKWGVYPSGDWACGKEDLADRWKELTRLLSLTDAEAAKTIYAKLNIEPDLAFAGILLGLWNYKDPTSTNSFGADASKRVENYKNMNFATYLYNTVSNWTSGLPSGN